MPNVKSFVYQALLELFLLNNSIAQWLFANRQNYKVFHLIIRHLIGEAVTIK